MRVAIPDSITVLTSLLFSLLATGVFLAIGLLICASVGMQRFDITLPTPA